MNVVSSLTIPSEFIINVIKIDLEQLNNQFMSLQVRGEGGIDRIRNITDREIKPEFENIDGIAGVQVYGGQENSVEVRLNRKACKALGITPALISQVLNNNSSDKTFAGKVYDGSDELFVNISSEYTDIKDIGNIIVRQQGPVLLNDVAEIFYGVRERQSYSRVNGMDAVTMTLVNDNQSNLIKLSHDAIDQVKKLNSELASSGIEIVVQNNSAETMEKNIDQIINLAVTGGFLAVLILWYFLRNIRLVTIIAVSIPASVYTAFNFFYAFNISINSLTLVGIALAIGMLVDNSVVVLENIYRLAGTGKDPGTAVKQGTKEVWRSIFASTLTTVIVFFPFIFSTNFLIRIIGKNIGVSIVSTLLVSLAVALLFIPMATFYLMHGKSSGEAKIFRKLSIHDRLIQAYHLVLKASMRKPAATIIGTLVVFFAALLISLTLSISSNREIQTPEFRLACSLASLCGKYGKDLIPLRSNLEPVEYNKSGFAFLDSSVRAVWSEGSLVENLNSIFSRRIIDSEISGEHKLKDTPKVYASFSDINAFIEGETDDNLIADLLWGLILVDWNRIMENLNLNDESKSRPNSLYALMKLCFIKKPGEKEPPPLTPMIHRVAKIGKSKEASEFAVRRLIGSNLVPAIERISLAPEKTRRIAAALLFPISERYWERLAEAVLRPEEEQV